MTNIIQHRIEELKLLGWSEAGAKAYSEQIVNQTLREDLISIEKIFVLISIISIIIISTGILLIKTQKTNKNTSLAIKSKKETIKSIQPDKEKELKQINNLKTRNKKTFIQIMIRELKNTAVNPGEVIEHALLILILSYEFTQKFLQEVAQTNKSINSNQFK